MELWNLTIVHSFEMKRLSYVTKYTQYIQEKLRNSN